MTVLRKSQIVIILVIFTLVTASHVFLTSVAFLRSSVIVSTPTTQTWTNLLKILLFPLGYVAVLIDSIDSIIVIITLNSALWGIAVGLLYYAGVRLRLR